MSKKAGVVRRQGKPPTRQEKEMRFIILVKATKESEAGQMPTREQLEPMGKFNEGLAKDGILLAADGLRPTSKATRLRFEGGRTTVIDGPFAETKELVAGFWIVQGKSREEIVERFTKAPFDRGETIEIRELFELEDFGEELTSAMREYDDRVFGGAKYS
jgi:hypothetical protein